MRPSSKPRVFAAARTYLVGLRGLILPACESNTACDHGRGGIGPGSLIFVARMTATRRVGCPAFQCAWRHYSPERALKRGSGDERVHAETRRVHSEQESRRTRVFAQVDANEAARTVAAILLSVLRIRYEAHRLAACWVPEGTDDQRSRRRRPRRRCQAPAFRALYSLSATAVDGCSNVQIKRTGGEYPPTSM